MHPLGQRRQVILFLVAILVPCALLLILGLRMLAQERELAGKRRYDDRMQFLDRVRQDLLARLERIKLEEAGARPAGPPDRAVVLVAAVEQRPAAEGGPRLVLPWEAEHAAEQFRGMIGQAEFASKLRQGEQEEFAAAKLEDAVRSYEEALRSAAGPAQNAYARLALARALDKVGRRSEAIAEFRRVIRVAPDVLDEEGIPLRLHAAERLAQAGAEERAVLETARWAAAGASSLPPAGCYMLSNVSRMLTRQASDEGARRAAAEIQERVAARIRDMDQAVALQKDFPRLPLPATETVWAVYGEEPWLVSAAASGSGGRVVIAVRAAEIFRAVEARWKSRELRFLTAPESRGEALEGFPGVRVSFAVPDDAALARRAKIQRYLFLASLLLVLGATAFGAYILWHDLRREARLAEVRAQFVSSVSHELKTPLTAIRMFAETLQLGRSPDPAAQTEYLDTIVNECERLSRLVDDVLHFSKLEQGRKMYQFRPTKLAGAVEAAARAMQYPLSQQGFDLRVKIDDELPPVRADRDAIEQAVLNLLSNAMKYSGESRAIDLDLARGDGEAVIRVTDYGVGIAPEEQGRIFDKYYRAPTRENQLIPGTGLGLTLVAHIARAHGGRVEVRSAPGQGSTFSIRLPLEAAPAAAPLNARGDSA